ncbi:Uma2 family endonuclease [Lacunimicrobium album]
MAPSSPDVVSENRLSEFDADERREKRFTVREYFQMAEKGILKGRPKTELIRGEIQVMLAVGLPHGICVMNFTNLLLGHLSLKSWCVISQSTAELGEESAPEPDIFVLQGPQSHFLDQTPLYSDYAHIIEVSDSSLRRDRGLKQSLYAEHGIANYWLVNMVDSSLEHYSDPIVDPTGCSFKYEKKVTYGEHDLVTMTFEGEPPLTFTPRDILPNSSKP